MFSTTGSGHPASRSLDNLPQTHTVAGIGPPERHPPKRDTAGPLDPSGLRGERGGRVGSVRVRGPVLRHCSGCLIDSSSARCALRADDIPELRISGSFSAPDFWLFSRASPDARRGAVMMWPYQSMMLPLLSAAATTALLPDCYI
ncbi:MAG: hypothetical protein JO281_20120 [Pseudonocardiales bacterium]|nr:hypothetical protein [Pseudonocardiales bacterium]